MGSDRGHCVLVLHHTLLLVELVHESSHAVGYRTHVLIPIFKDIRPGACPKSSVNLGKNLRKMQHFFLELI